MNASSLVSVCFGEVLWDVLPTGPRAGGAPMNVAYHLGKLGWDSKLISRIGNDQWGTDLLKQMDHKGIDSSHVQLDSIHPTGLVNATIGANHEVSYEIVQPSAWDFIAEKSGLKELVAQSRVFVFGSLACRHAITRKTLLTLLEGANFRVMDINLRPPFIFPELMGELLPTLKILKLNEHELPLISSWFSGPDGDEDQLRFLQDRFHIPSIIVTRGGEGAMVIQEGHIFQHSGFPVQVADTIGSGDAFLAAFLTATFRGLPAEICLEVANALGSLVASKEGACPDYDAILIETIMAKK